MVSGWFHGLCVVSWYSGGFMVFRWFHVYEMISSSRTYALLTYITYIHNA